MSVGEDFSHFGRKKGAFVMEMDAEPQEASVVQIPTQRDPRNYTLGFVALGIILLIGVALGAYYGDRCSDAKNFFNGDISVGKGLLEIALPITAVGVATAFILYVYTKYRNERKKHQDGSSIEKPNAPTFLGTFKTLAPSKNQIKVIVTAFAILVVVGSIAALVLTQNATCNQWMHDHLFPDIKSEMGYSIKLWQGLAYMGLSSLALMIIANLALHAHQKRVYRQEAGHEFDF